jgi:protein TonB
MPPPTTSSFSDSPPRGPVLSRALWRGFRVIGAVALTALLVVFMVAARLFDSNSQPDREIRKLETIEEVAMPAPPPPPPIEPDQPPPPPPPPTLPRLEIQLENIAPPVTATLDRRVDLTMETVDFSLEIDPIAAPRLALQPVSKPAPPRPRTSTPEPPKPAPSPKPVMKQSYSAGELDARPRLINRPAAAYPAALLRQGVKQGRVVLEVAISSSGGVSVRRVISSSHPELAAMARSFASRARFTVPRKNGQPVTAIYQWPLILKP